MAFDENKYKAIFEQRYGSGSFESGLSNARSVGRTKAAADFAKAEYKRRRSEAEKRAKNKTYDDALSEWQDPIDKDALKRDGAAKIANDIRNDPRKQEAIKAGGYSVDEYINALYSAASDGKFRSEREYKQHASNLSKSTKTEQKARDKEYKQKYGMSYQEYSDIPKKEIKKEKNTLGKISDFIKSKDKNNDGNPDGLMGLVEKIDRPADALRTGIKDKFDGNSFFDGVKRGWQDKDFTTTGKDLNKSLGFNPDKDTKDKIGASLLGKTILNKVPGSEFALNRMMKGNASEKVGKEAAGMATEVVTDPLNLIGGGLVTKGINKLGKAAKSAVKVASKADDVLGLPAPKPEPLGLPEPQMKLPEPKPMIPEIKRPPTQLNNPIPQIPDVLRQPMAQARLESKGLGFGIGSKYEPKAKNRMMLPQARQNQSYWQKRYEDFSQYISSNYDTNSMTPETLQEAWSQFARYDEPVQVEELIDLAYPKGFEAPQKKAIPEPIPVEEPPAPTIKDDLKADPRINELVKGLYPPQRPISRVATNDEIIRQMEETVAAQRKPEDILKPLQFKRTIPSKPLVDEVAATAEAGVKPRRDFEAITPIKEEEPKLINLEAERKALEEKQIRNALWNSDEWKDKGRFFLGRETMERNFDDVMGKDAPKLKRKYLDPIKSKEAERVRFLNTERERVKSYGIKPKSEDDKLVQMYGEKKIDLKELKAKTKNWKKVVKVAESYRAKYDELLTTVNKELEANGFDPIPKRADYFPHYEEVDGLMKQLGFDMENHTLPTDINGLTDTFKPSKNFFGNALRRKSDETTYGAIEGFDRYIEGVSNLIFHTKNVKQLRSFAKGIRNKYSGDTQLANFAAELDEYTNILAGKKAKVDRVIEDRFGRKVFNVVDTLRRRTGANMIGANVASALTNFIPLTQSLATTNKKAFTKALTDTISNVVKSDGFVEQSDFLTKRIGSDPLVRTLWDKTIDKSMWLMRSLDSFTSQVITRGKYNELIEKGIAHKTALKQADDWAAKIMADRSKGGMPTLFSSKTFGIVSQFQLEVNNQVSVLMKDVPRNAESKAALASAIGQILIYSYVYNELYEKAVGRRPALDPIGIAFQAGKDYNNSNITNSEATSRLTENVLNTLPFTSIVNGGRFPISAGIPHFGEALKGKADWGEEALKPLVYLGLPAGGAQLKKSLQGITAMDLNPLSPQNMEGKYQTEKDGDKVLKYPIEDSVSNNFKAGLFGPNSLPETREFYDNKRRNLSSKQTAEVENSPNPKERYELFMNQRRINTLQEKISKIQKDNGLTETDKKKKMLPLIQELQKFQNTGR